MHLINYILNIPGIEKIKKTLQWCFLGFLLCLQLPSFATNPIDSLHAEALGIHPLPLIESNSIVPETVDPFLSRTKSDIHISEIPGGIEPLQKSMDQLASQLEKNIYEKIKSSLESETEMNSEQIAELFSQKYRSELLAMPVINGDQDDLRIGTTADKIAEYKTAVGDARKVINAAICSGNFLSKLTGDQDLITLPICIGTGGLSSGSNIPDCVPGIGGEQEPTAPPGFRATMVISEIKLFSNYTQLHVYVMIESAILGDTPLIFYSPDLKYSSTSGIIGDAFIGLMADFPVHFFEGKVVLNFKKGTQGLASDPQSYSEGSFVEVACNGVENLAIAGDVIFSRDWIRPPTVNGTSTGRITSTFAVQNLKKPSELFVQLSIPAFEIKGVPDYVWEASDMSLDFSEIVSPAFITGKTQIDYQTMMPNGTMDVKSHILDGTNALWKGFHAGRIGVTIPRQLTEGANNQNDIKIYVDNLIIDGNGIGGKAVVESAPLLAFGEANMNGWGIALDNMSFVIVHSTDWQVVFDGKIYVPLFADKNNQTNNRNENDAIAYTAEIDPQNGYNFYASLTTDKNIPAWIANAEIKSTSFLQFGYNTQDQKMEFTAHVDANISIDGKMTQNMDINLPTVGIRNLQIANHGTTKLQFGSIELIDLGAVDLGFLKLEMDVNGGTAGNGSPEGRAYADGVYERADIDFFLKVTVAIGEDLTGTGGFVAEGKLEESTIAGGLDKWLKNDLRLKTVHVIAEEVIPGISYFEAFLEFYKETEFGPNEQNWGNGFRAFAIIRPKALFGELRAVAQFGSIPQAGGDKKKYFMIDAAAEFTPGLPLSPAISIIGFGGGCYFNLERPSATQAFNQIALDSEDNDFLTEYGATLSGVTLSPTNSSTTVFGFMASVVLTNPDPSGGAVGDGMPTAYTVNVEFGMQFSETTNGNKKWGIDLIYFMGSGKFFDKVDFGIVPLDFGDPSDPNAATTGVMVGEPASYIHNMVTQDPNLPDCMVAAKVLIQFNFDCPSFYGAVGVYIDAQILKGVVESEIYIGKNCPSSPTTPNVHWNVSVGKPETPNYLMLDLVVIRAVVTSYFMMGNFGLPSDLPEPSTYTSLFGSNADGVNTSEVDNNLDQVDLAHPDIFSGKGMALGLGFAFNVHLKFLFMYANVGGGFGFDILLNKLAQSACTDGLGFKGWYAKGQAWMFVTFGVGVEFKIFGRLINYDVLSAKMGALLELEGPNPFFAQGRVDVEFQILMIKAKTQFKAKIGTPLEEYLSPSCADELGSISEDVIAEIVPTLPKVDGKIPVQSLIDLELNFVPNTVAPVTVNGKTKEYRVGVIKEYIHNSSVLNRHDYKNHAGLAIPIKTSVQNSDSNELSLMDTKNTSYTWDDTPIAFSASYINYNGDRQPKLRIRPNNYLPSNSKIRVSGVGMLSRTGFWDAWVEEIKAIRPSPLVAEFETADYDPQVDFVLEQEDIYLSYPVKNMKNFYKDEFNQTIPGYAGKPAYWLTLNGDKSKIWDPEYLPDGYSPKLRFIDKATGQQVGDYLDLKVKKLSTGKDVIYFSKNEELELSKTYTFQLIYPPEMHIDEIPDCYGLGCYDEGGYTGGYTYDTTYIVNPDFGADMIIYEMDFETSKYQTVQDKINNIAQLTGVYYNNNDSNWSSNDNIQAVFTTDEEFSSLENVGIRQFEMNAFPGHAKIGPLLRWEVNKLPVNQTYTSLLFNDTESCLGEVFGWLENDHPRESISYGALSIAMVFHLETPNRMFEMHIDAIEYILNNGTCVPSWQSAFLNGLFQFPEDDRVNDVYEIALKYHVPWEEGYTVNDLNELENMRYKESFFDLEILNIESAQTAPPNNPIPPNGTSSF